MVSSNIPSGQSEIAVIQASRQQRLEIQAARHAAFNDACFRADPDQSESALPTPTNFPIFVHDPDALARALGTAPPPPTLTPARILDADEAQSVLVRTTWWTARCRLPRPCVDGVFALLPRQTVMPLLEAYYSNKFEATFVPIKLQDTGRIMLAAACIWTGRPAPVSTRRLFFHGHGSLAEPETLGKVLKAPPAHAFQLVPAVLEGWRGLESGADSERVEGCTYECAGRMIPLIEDYYGEHYAPIEVTVSVAGWRTVSARGVMSGMVLRTSCTTIIQRLETHFDFPDAREIVLRMICIYVPNYQNHCVYSRRSDSPIPSGNLALPPEDRGSSSTV